jgi:hypothetical protein
MALIINNNIPKKKSPASEYDQHLVSTPAIGTIQSVKMVGIKGAKSEKTMLDEKVVINPGVMIPKNNLCMVKFGASHTVNLGNYESAKITVSVEMPSTKEDLNDTYQFAESWVSEKIQTAISDTKS